MGKLHGGRRTRLNSYIAWGAALVGFLAVELLGLFRRGRPGLQKRIPWFTLSETVWAVFRATPGPLRVLLKIGLVTFLLDLAVHLTVGTPLTP